MEDVYISYSRTDHKLARRLAQFLDERGHSAVIDLDLPRKAEWKVELEQAIEAAPNVILLLTPASVRSKWVEKELLAAAEAGQHMIPVIGEPVSADLIPTTFSNRSMIDLAADFEVGAYQIAELLTEAEQPSLRVRGSESTSTILLSPIGIDELAKQIAVNIAMPETGSMSRLGPRASAPNQVFVIISFTPEMEPTFKAIQAAAAEVGLEARRVKDVRGDYRITEKILSMIAESRFVVADLTRERPNVYFELGYARGLDKPIITIARRDAEIHFDVQDWKCIKYFDSRPLEEELVAEFEHYLETTS